MYAVVHKFVLVEYDMDYNLIRKTVLDGPFVDGDVLDFVTVSAGEVYGPAQIARTWELYLDGATAQGLRTGSLFSIHWSNDCDSDSPSLAGKQIGPTIFTSATSPPETVCKGPAGVVETFSLEPPTPAPVVGSITPTTTNTAGPTSSPTSSPTQTSLGVGRNRCACQPSEYALTLDFSRTCTDTTRLTGGASVVRCDDASGVYAKINKVVVVEFDGEYNLIEKSKTIVEGPFLNGDSVDLKSATAYEVTDLSELPRFAEYYFDGEDSEGNRIGGMYALRFLFTCEDHGLPLTNFEIVGVTQFVSLLWS